jgi:hypothetical protein
VGNSVRRSCAAFITDQIAERQRSKRVRSTRTRGRAGDDRHTQMRGRCAGLQRRLLPRHAINALCYTLSAPSLRRNPFCWEAKLDPDDTLKSKRCSRSAGPRRQLTRATTKDAGTTVGVVFDQQATGDQTREYHSE